MPDKVIVTNLTALESKYKAAGVKAIKEAVAGLIAADKKRGLKTVLVAIDNPAAMKKLKATPVTKPADPMQNKKRIDGVYKALAPDFLMILGAIDVIPHQDLKNPMFNDPEGDDEKFAYADLPYACDAQYSQDVNDFAGPTRVVSRLPDLTGASSPKYLIDLLKTATTWKSFSKPEYQPYLGITAHKWRGSTSQSLANIFSSDTDMQTSPKKGFRWKTALINRRSHFINCHGGDTYPNFLGQSSTDDEDMPVSHKAAFVSRPGNIKEGTVVAAECCFGAQLYDPTAEEDGQMGMCNSYLSKKAYGFLGSTTTAYGPFSGNDQADLICQYFLQRVLAGASLGRAALEARQRFVEKTSPMGGMNQKTLAQFNLYGDPSITPVSVPTPHIATGTTFGITGGAPKSAGAALKASQETGAVARAERREKLRAKGLLLAQLQPSMTRDESGPPKDVDAALKKMMSQLNCKPVDTISLKVQQKETPMLSAMGLTGDLSKAAIAKTPQTTAFHLFFGVPKSAKGSASGASASKKSKGRVKVDGLRAKPLIRKLVVLEAKEVNGKIVSITEAHSK